MLPTKLTGADPEAERQRFRIVRKDTFKEVLPGSTIVSADAASDVCWLRPAKRPDEPAEPAAQEFSFGPGGLAIVARTLRRWFPPTLAGCAPLGKFTAGDAANAAAIDPAAAACYQALGTVATAVGSATADTGILTVVATQRAGQGALQSPACAPVEASVLGLLLKATPVAPFVP